MAYYIKNSLVLAQPTKKGHLSEVNLFRQMMLCFKLYYGATVVIDETHSRYVGFATTDPLTGQTIQNKTNEISDLHIITYSPSLRVARETYLQAKVARKGDGFLSDGSFKFSGDWFQYDLLSRRPHLLRPLKKKPYHRLLCNPSFLSSAILPSVGSYGVFYIDGNNRIDFAYQPANLLRLQPNNTSLCQLKIDTNLSKYGTPLNIPDLQYSYDADEFEYAVIHNLIGTPLQWRCIPVCLRNNLFWGISDRANSSQILRETEEGLEEFETFLLNNREIFLLNHDNHDHLRHYQELNMFTDYSDLPHNGEISPREYNNQEDELCKGTVSLVLINTDKLVFSNFDINKN